MTDKYRPLKDAMGRFATGVAIAACPKDDGTFAAITINSFASVSLEPSLVLWCLETKASSYGAFMAAQNYSVTILREDQKSLSNRFANYAPEPFTGEEIEFWQSGSPILKDRLAAFDCKIFARHFAGDHIILVGEVLQFDSKTGAPLMYFASNFIPDDES